MSAAHTIPKVVKLDSDISDRLTRLGEIKHRSPHWLMKEAIVRYLEQEEYNEALNHETLARWQEEFGQGKVISHDAVVKWLNTWGTDDGDTKPE
ncbi:MAG: transcriptional regulator, CopG family [Gammaproteobacteria bacterium]|jgi:predicted transcriptional regulator|nr:transcriptional regulator, CopG family [Gammaproteobacteria bacterium]